MNNSIFKYSILFVFLILIQVLILNNVYFLGYINPLVYILFIFLFPLNKEKVPLLVIAFFLGLGIDIFSNSGGSNAAATLFIAYLRLPVLHIIQNKSEFDYLLFDIKKLNFLQILVYIFTLTIIHHIIVFTLEYYRLQGLTQILLSSLLTSLLTTLLIGFSIALFIKKK